MIKDLVGDKTRKSGLS